MEQAAPNICVRVQTGMLRAALVLLTIALALSVIVVRTEVDTWYRLALFLPFSLASINLYQAFFKT